MKLALQFLLFLKRLITFLRKRWDHSTRRLWYIFAFVRSRILSQNPGRGDEIRRSVEHRPAKPPTAVICASRFPPPLTPIVGGDTPIASPTPVSIQVRQPTILNREDTVCEAQDNHGREYLGVDGYFLEGIEPISRSTDSPTLHHEPESIHAAPPSHRENRGPNYPVIPSRPISQHSGHSGSQYSYRPQPRYPPSHYSNRSHLSGAEAAARGYLNAPPGCSSPVPSVRPGSVTGSVSSRVYRASRPKTRVPRPSPMRNASKRRPRSSTRTSPRHSLHGAPPEPPRPESGTSESLHRDRPSTTVSFDPALLAPQKDRLRPIVGIDRYEKQRVVIEDVINTHIFPPVTTEFVR